MDDKTGSGQPPALLINEIQLVLAEKRTSMSTLRTGIAVMALPLSILGLLIATSKYYSVASVLQLLIPLAVITLGMLVLGIYLITRAVHHIHGQDRLIKQLKRKNTALAQFMD